MPIGRPRPAHARRPNEHRPLAGRGWSDAEAVTAIELVAQDAIGAYQDPERLRANAVEDLEGDADRRFRDGYCGAAGVVRA